MTAETPKLNSDANQTVTTSSNSRLQNYNIGWCGVWIGSIYFAIGIISYCIGLYGISEFRRVLNNSYEDSNVSTDCMESASNVPRRTNLPIGGLSCVFIFEFIWYAYSLYHEMTKFGKTCNDTPLYEIWNEYGPFCYYSYAWILFQWVICLSVFE